MFVMDLRIDTYNVKNRLGTMAKKTNLVMAHAANQAAKSGKTLLKRETAAKYLIRQKDISSLVKITKAYARKPYAVLLYKDGYRNLAHWPLKDKNLSPYNKVIQFDSEGRPNVKVYKAAIEKKQGKQKLGGSRKPFIQIARKSGNIALFRRISSNSNEIEGVAGPSFPQLIQTPEIMDKFRKESKDVFSKCIESEIDRILKK